MLTINFSEIVSVFKEQIDANTIDKLSAEDIGNINLMLRGYLGLIQSGFKTKDDSDEPSSKYYVHLKELLTKLTPAQRAKLKKTKQSLRDSFIAELSYISRKMEAHPLLKNPKHQKLINEYRTCVQLFENKLDEYVNDEHCGFIKSIQTGIELSSKMSNILSFLQNEASLEDISAFKEQLELVSTTYLKKMTYWYNIEKDNHQCETYVVSGEFMDVLINS